METRVFSNYIKRALDILAASMACLILALPLIALILAVRAKLGRPVFFCQTRPGLQGRPFKMVKLRTMTNERRADGQSLPDAERITQFGRFLRTTSMDELPELWNVLKGDMSIVGPRPLLMEYMPLYTSQQRRRHEVKPGITGWAQINGRNALSWEEKFALDIWYVENQSFTLDVKIMLMTIKKVLLREDISAAGEATMPRFTGSAGAKAR